MKNISVPSSIHENLLMGAFCIWQRDYFKRLSLHYDSAIFFTRNIIDKDDIEAAGLAYFGAVCYKKLNCAMIRDTGKDTVTTITHELGHL